jgi:hypothetical protein
MEAKQMSLGLAFWVIVLVWIIIGIPWPFYPAPWPAWPGHLIELLLFVLLGWRIFGAPVHG